MVKIVKIWMESEESSNKKGLATNSFLKHMLPHINLNNTLMKSKNYLDFVLLLNVLFYKNAC